jgi:hypothetical protein
VKLIFRKGQPVRDNNKYKQNNIIQMLDGLISNIFVLFGGLVYQQTTGIPMGKIVHPSRASQE